MNEAEADILPSRYQVAVATSDGAEQPSQVAQDDEGGAGMSELIDRQALLDAIEKDVFASDSVKSFVRCVAKGLPTIYAVEVRHGEWIIDGAFTYNLENDGKAYEPVYRCSCCHRQTESYLRLDEPKMPEDADFPEYCPHCGARMDGKEAPEA